MGKKAFKYNWMPALARISCAKEQIRKKKISMVVLIIIILLDWDSNKIQITQQLLLLWNTFNSTKFNGSFICFFD